MRNRGKLRKAEWKHAERRKRIADAIYPGAIPYYDDLHRYSKNKIHCSCYICSGCSKTNQKGRGKLWSVSDTRKIDRMNIAI